MKAARFIGRRIASGALLLVGVSILSFCLASLVPGDYLDEMRLNPQISSTTIVQFRSQYGLNQPLPLRYFHWITELMRGDLGFSFVYNMPVSTLISERCRNTVLLAAIATAGVWIIALPLGIFASARAGWLEGVLSFGNSCLLSVPELVILLSLLAFAVRTGSLPVGGMNGSPEGMTFWFQLRDLAQHAVIPVLALALVGLPVVFYHARMTIKEVLNTPFIKAARGHGIGSTRMLMRHALPAAANPLISLFALSVAGLVGTSLIAEVMTGWPGLGPLFVQSIFARDFYVVIAIAMLASAFLVIGNLLGDVLLYAVDPRIRAS